MRMLHSFMSMALVVAASRAATISANNGAYSATIDNQGNPGSLIVTINGPAGTKTWTYAGTDILGELVLGDKGILAFTAELTADPILEAIDYAGTTCNPCGYGGPLFTDPANTSGHGGLPFRPFDFSSSSPYPSTGIITGPFWADLTGWDSNGMLTGILLATQSFPTSQVALRIPYTWGVMVNTPEPGTWLPVLSGMAMLAGIRRMRRR